MNMKSFAAMAVASFLTILCMAPAHADEFDSANQPADSMMLADNSPSSAQGPGSGMQNSASPMSPGQSGSMSNDTMPHSGAMQNNNMMQQNDAAQGTPGSTNSMNPGSGNNMHNGSSNADVSPDTTTGDDDY